MHHCLRCSQVVVQAGPSARHLRGRRRRTNSEWTQLSTALDNPTAALPDTANHHLPPSSSSLSESSLLSVALSYSAQVYLPGPQPLLGLQRGGAPGRASYTDTRYTPGGTIPIRLLGLPRRPRLEDSGLTAAASTLTQVLRSRCHCRASPPPPLTFSDIHGVTGVPQEAAAL